MPADAGGVPPISGIPRFGRWREFERAALPRGMDFGKETPDRGTPVVGDEGESMTKRWFQVFAPLVLAVGATACQHPYGGDSTPRRALPCMLVVIEGIRLDYATPEVMPNLTRLGASGVVFENHRAVFPAESSVNAATLVTGASPGTHGLLGEEVYFPEVASVPLRTDATAALQAIDRGTGGRVLTALTLGELLEGEGRKVLVAGAGPEGLMWLLGYGSKPRPGRSSVVSPELAMPEAVRPMLEGRIGAAPGAGAPYDERNGWATDALIELGLGEERPALSMLWLTGVGRMTREKGVGSAEALEAARSTDAQLGRLLAELERRKLRDQTNVIVTSDHGFIRHDGGPSLHAVIAAGGRGEEMEATPMIVAGPELYMSGEGETKAKRLEGLAGWLGRQPQVGAVFSRNGSVASPAGRVTGTLSYETIGREHPRAGDLLVTAPWGAGPAGSTHAGLGMGEGIAGSGGASPFELNVPMVAAGPGFKRGGRSALPSSHADVAPTLLALIGSEPPASMDGRVLREALRGGPEAEDMEVLKASYRTRTAAGANGQKISEVHQWNVEGVEYLQWVRTSYLTHAGPEAPTPRPEGGSGAIER